MSKDLILKYTARISVFHKILYLSFIIYFLLIRCAGLSNGNFSIIFYTIVTILFIVADEFLFRHGHSLDDSYYGGKCIVQILCYSIGCLFGRLTLMEYMAIVILQVVILFEFIVFNSLFDEYTLNVKRISGILGILLGLVGAFRPFHIWELIIIDFTFAVMIGGAVWFLSDFFIRRIREYDKQMVELYYENQSLKEDKKEMIEYQERVRQVNNEINFQKINLAKVNNDLENMNNEIRSQIEVMKYFSSGFDVPKSVNLLTDEIMEIKGAGICAFYIAEGIYMNRYPDIVIKSKISLAQQRTEKYIEKIYELIRERNSTEPLVLTENADMLYDFYKDTGVLDAVAFPAYENDIIYGVMIVASNKRDFFEGGYNYYESFLMEFSAALRSTKLYLKMQDIARRDGLTGIYNRVYFNEIFSKISRKAAEEHRSLSVALFDIDKFKHVNDTYGHLAGDEVIKMVAGVDRDFAEEYNGIACRYGGEEFLLILPGVSCEAALSILETLHERIKSTKVQYEDYSIDVNVCIGLASYPETCGSVEHLISRADAAMYYAKRNGRGRLIVDRTYEE